MTLLPVLYFAAAVGVLFAALRLTCGPCVMGYPGDRDGAATLRGGRIPLVPLGWALSLFLAVTFILCVGFDLLFPAYAMNRIWAPLLPGFTWLSPTSFIIGLTESFLYGWYVTLIFGGLFNAFANRS